MIIQDRMGTHLRIFENFVVDGELPKHRDQKEENSGFIMTEGISWSVEAQNDGTDAHHNAGTCFVCQPTHNNGEQAVDYGGKGKSTGSSCSGPAEFSDQWLEKDTIRVVGRPDDHHDYE